MKSATSRYPCRGVLASGVNDVVLHRNWRSFCFCLDYACGLNLVKMDTP